MSYRFQMNFKQCESKEEAFTIALAITKEYFRHAKSVIKDNIYYFPSIQRGGNKEYELADEWFLVNLFSLRFVWWEDKKLLGLNNDSDFLKSFFDTEVYFQNSCDQDYEYDGWDDKIDFFKETKRKIQERTKEELLKCSTYFNESDLEDDLEYCKRTILYDMIFSELDLNAWMYDSDETVFERFSLCAIDSSEKRFKARDLLEKVKKNL